jgi:hypothetical protein
MEPLTPQKRTKNSSSVIIIKNSTHIYTVDLDFYLDPLIGNTLAYSPKIGHSKNRCKMHANFKDAQNTQDLAER